MNYEYSDAAKMGIGSFSSAGFQVETKTPLSHLHSLFMPRQRFVLSLQFIRARNQFSYFIKEFFKTKFRGSSFKWRLLLSRLILHKFNFYTNISISNIDKNHCIMSSLVLGLKANFSSCLLQEITPFSGKEPLS